MKKLFALLLLLLWTAPAAAATYWVSKTGTNPSCATIAASNGTNQTIAKSTIDAGIACMSAGDTLNIRAGTYAETIRQSGWPSGSGTTYSTVQAYNNEAVTITPVGWNFAFYNADSHHILLRGIKFDSGGTGEAPVIQNGSHHITFDSIEITNANATTNLGGDGIIIRNSTFHDHVSGCVPGTRWYGLYISATNDLVVENSTFYNLPGGGIQAYNSGGTPNTNLTIRNNVFHNVPTCDTSNIGGFLISDTSSGQAYNNVIYATQIGAGGQYVSAIQLYNGASNFNVYNNTIYNTHTGYGIELAGSVSGTSNIRNNILSTTNPYSNTSTGGVTVNASNNLCLTNCGFGSLNQAEAAATTFTTPGSDFSLKTGSLAINTGTINIGPGINIPACSGGTTTNCYNGTLPDLGAIETGVPTVGGGPPTITPNLTSVVAGAAIILTVDDNDVNERVEDVGDWVGIFEPGEIGYVDWFYMNGTKTAPTTPISDAVIPFTAPLILGLYEFRFYRNGSSLEVDRLATAAFSVIAPGIVMKFNVSALKIGPSVTLKIGTP